jgi:hypothetical protein
VDSQLLNKIYLGATDNFGINFIASSIGEVQIPFFDYTRAPRKLDFDCGKVGKKLSSHALVHAVQVIIF